MRPFHSAPFFLLLHEKQKVDARPLPLEPDAQNQYTKKIFSVLHQTFLKGTHLLSASYTMSFSQDKRSFLAINTDLVTCRLLPTSTALEHLILGSVEAALASVLLGLTSFKPVDEEQVSRKGHCRF